MPRSCVAGSAPGLRLDGSGAHSVLRCGFSGPYTLDGEMYTATSDQPLILDATKDAAFCARHL